MNINEIKKQKGERKDAAEKLVNAAIATGVDLAGADLEQYNGHIQAIQGMESLIARHLELSGIRVDGGSDVVVDPKGKDKVNPRATTEYTRDFFAYLRSGEVQAALNIGTPAQGGYAVPQEFDTALVLKLQNENVMRQLATVITTESDRNITVENNLGSAGWSAEAAVATNDNGADDNSFNRVTLGSYKLTRIIKVSEELLQDAMFDIQGYLAGAFGKAFGIAEEAAFVGGNGTGKPTGVLSGASDSGIVTAAPAAIVFDEVLSVYHGLKRAYRDHASWLLNDSTALLIRKLKDTTGQYIWQPNVTQGLPALLLGKPVFTSDAMPTAVATNKSLLFGDFSYYTIADRSARSFTRLNELYAANGQVGFRGVERTDGKTTLSEAIVFLTQHA